MNIDLGTLLKASLMCIVAKSARCAGLGAFRPSCMCCVSVVRSVVVERLALKPCLAGERMMLKVILLRILRGLRRRDNSL